MRNRTLISLFLLSTLLPNATYASTEPLAAPQLDGHALPPAARTAIDAMIAKGTPGVTVVFGGPGQETVRSDVGQIAADTRYPIASASKWLAAATVMALVDEGKLSLDKPVSTWLRGAKGTAGEVTLRQLLAQTSGVAGGLGELYDLKQDHRITLRQSADDVLARPLSTQPGTVFNYGGPGFQVAGAVVEAVTGHAWDEVFQSRIARPLGMTGTVWTHLKFGEATPPPAETRNPVLQGGAIGTADDYVRFLEMLAGKGTYKGHRVLSEQAVAEMMRDQTPSAKILPTNAALLENAHYGLGNWCETWDAQGHCTRSSSIGAFGTYPWVDLPTGRFGLVFINRQTDAFAVWPEILAIQAAADAVLGGKEAVAIADAPTADPLHYKVEFENADVRVLRIKYPAHSKGEMHDHPRSVTVFLTEGHLRMTMPGGKTMIGNVGKGASIFEEAGPHQPENLSDRDFEAVRIELKK